MESQSQEPRLLVLSFPIFKKLQVELTYSVVLTTAVQLSGSVIRTHTRTHIYRLFRVLSSRVAEWLLRTHTRTHVYRLFRVLPSRVKGRTLTTVPCALYLPCLPQLALTNPEFRRSPISLLLGSASLFSLSLIPILSHRWAHCCHGVEAAYVILRAIRLSLPDSLHSV